MVLEKTLESPLDCKEIQPVHSEGDQLRRPSYRDDGGVLCIFSRCGARMGFLTRYDGELRESLVW